MLTQITKKWWFRLLLIGVALRVILMPITLHPDLWGHSFVAYFFAYEGRLNIYEHLVSLASDHPLVTNFGIADIFIYPPLTYYTLGIFRVLVKPFSDPNFIPWLMENLGNIYSYDRLSWHLFLFKFPYLVLDVVLAFLLAGLFKDKKKKKRAFLLWMLNPISLYATFMIGQLDLLPTLFSLLAIVLIARKKYVWSMISLGIGGSYKMFPLLFIFPAAFYLAKSLKGKMKYLFWGFLPFVLTTLPFINSKAFRSMVFSPKSQKMLFMGWPVSGAEVILPFILFLSLIYFHSYYKGRKLNLSSQFLAILLLIFSVTHYHPQWFLWVTPFLILDLVKTNFKRLPLAITLLTSWLIITLFFEPSLSIGLFNPIWPESLNALGLAEVVSRYTDPFLIKSIVRSVFAGASIYYVLTMYNEKKG